MEAEFRGLLAEDAAVKALVGPRIYWNMIPQNAASPCVALYKITRQADAHHGGPSGLDFTLVQVDVRSAVQGSGTQAYRDALAVRDAIVALLHAKRLSRENVEFKSIHLTNERQTSEKPGSDLYHRVSLDFEMWTGCLS